MAEQLPNRLSWKPQVDLPTKNASIDIMEGGLINVNLIFDLSEIGVYEAINKSPYFEIHVDQQSNGMHVVGCLVEKANIDKAITFLSRNNFEVEK